MFRKAKDKELDVTNLNSLIKTSNRILKIGYIMIIVSLVLVGTYLLKEWKILNIIKNILVVLSPVFIGFLIAWLFEPLVTKLAKKKVPRMLGCIIVYIIIIGAILGIGYFFIPTLASQIKDFVEIAPGIFEELTDFLINLINKLNINNLVETKNLRKDIIKALTDYGMGIASSLPKYIMSIGKSIVSGGLNVILGLMVGFYLLYDFKKVNNSIEKVIPRNWLSNYKELVKRINTSLRSYVQGVLLIMLLVFITQSIGLSLAGLEAPFLFALFCAVTDIIPYFGPYIGGIPAVIVGLTISPITGLCVLISIIIVQQLENNFYQPLIIGHTVQLHPVVIMCGLLLFQHFFGIIGMVISTPVIACIKELTTFVIEKIEENNKALKKD